MRCPKCGAALCRLMPTFPNYWDCYTCHKAFHKDECLPDPRAPAAPHVAEADVEAAFVARARAEGFEVLTTSEHRKAHACSKCGHVDVNHTGDGVSPGIPDDIVSHPSWPPLLWAGFEAKGSHTPVQPAQARLCLLGRTLIYRNPDVATEALRRLHERIKHFATQDAEETKGR